MTKKVTTVALVLLFCPFGFSSKTDILITTIQPIKWLIDRIVVDKFEVISVVSKGKDYHTIEIQPSLVAKLSKARAYFSIGLGDSEKGLIMLIKNSNPSLEDIDISEGINKIMVKHHHSHDKACQKNQIGIDPHMWLSPKNMKIMAKNVFERLSKMDPDNIEFYRLNYEKLIRDLDKLDEYLTVTLKPFRGKRFLVFHSVFKYFERDYGVVEMSIETEGKEISPRELTKIVNEAKKHKINVVFVQSGFSQKSAITVASQIGGKVIEIDHVDYDYLNNMRKIANLIRGSYN
ncbi:MAG: zinc ABC transporter substrate-binding protein [Brevinematales bacterium]|nr:zinc ABC transporter substrate-binding protein [Brevinematales bacterium]